MQKERSVPKIVIKAGARAKITDVDHLVFQTVTAILILGQGSLCQCARCQFEASNLRKLDSTARIVDFYQLLAVPRDASLADIKAAYHRALLRSHPDKQNNNLKSVNLIDIALIKEAYTTLSNTELRASHDAELSQRLHAAGPRPAQVVSLEEFEDESTQDSAEDAEEGPWRYGCRCGGWYRISTALMEKGEHLIACNSCSEAVWVGYEQVEP